MKGEGLVTGLDEMNIAMVIGRVEGRMGELVHAMNNLNGKVDGLHREFGALSKEVGALTMLSKGVSDNREAIVRLEAEVQALQQGQARRDGANNVVSHLLSSPLVPYILLLAGLVYVATQNVLGV